MALRLMLEGENVLEVAFLVGSLLLGISTIKVRIHLSNFMSSTLPLIPSLPTVREHML